MAVALIVTKQKSQINNYIYVHNSINFVTSIEWFLLNPAFKTYFTTFQGKKQVKQLRKILRNQG